jgi:hypothetical protein
MSIKINESFITGQVTIGTTPTLINSAELSRDEIILINMSAVQVFIGNSAVTPTTGVLLNGVIGAELDLPFTDALYGIVASGTALVSFIDAC